MITATTVQIRIQGRNTQVPALNINGRDIIVTGKWLRTASVRDEAHLPGELVDNPEQFIQALRDWEHRPDIFTFAQKISDPTPLWPYPHEWDDFAVIPISTYDNWVKTQIKKDVKENIRRATREGVVTRICAYDDAFVAGIKALCDETPIRQGKRFWHHGKSLEAIREVHGTYCERAEYIGAFFGDELIGFIKMVYTDDFAKTMHVISKEKYFNKRTVTALIAKAVQTCAERGVKNFIYGEYNFPGKKRSSLSIFKQHHGFLEVKYPRYFVPLTLKGELALQADCHRTLRRHVPFPVLEAFLRLRAYYYRRKVKPMAVA